MNINTFFLAQKSLRNLAREGTYSIVSSKGMLKHTCLNISIISLMEFLFFALVNLWGNRNLGTYSRGLLSSFSFGDDSLESKGTPWIVFSPTSPLYWWLLCLFRKIMMALTSSCCYGELVLTSCTPLRLGIGWLGNLSFSIVIAKV